MNDKVMVIYHGGCQDGFMAAVIAQRYFSSRSVSPVVMQAAYGSGDLNIGLKADGHDVYMLGVGPTEAFLREVSSYAARVVVIEHQPQGEDMLSRLKYEGVLEYFHKADSSGAGLTWDYLYPNEKRPALVDYVEDRGLFRKKFEHCDDVYLALSSYPMTFHAWSPLLDGPVGKLIDEGKVLSAKRYRDIADILRQGLIRAEIDGYNVPAINAPDEMASDIGALMADSEPFALIFSYTAAGISLNLRSVSGHGVDVNEIAKKCFGGGGHKTSAGAIIPVSSAYFDTSADGRVVMHFDSRKLWLGEMQKQAIGEFAA